MTIKTIYQGDLHTECIHIQSQSILYTDAPTDHNGKGENFSPTDLLVTAAASCAITNMAISASQEGIEFKGTEVIAIKYMTTTPPRKVDKIELVLKMKSIPTLTDDQKMKYENLGINCPVLLSLSSDLVKTVRFEW